MLLEKKTGAADRRRGEMDRLFHELQVYQFELEMQVKELRLSSDALQIQKDKFKLLFDLAPVSYLVINRKGVTTDINNSGVALLGVDSKNRALSKPLTTFIDSADIDIFYRFLKGMFDGAERQHQVLHFLNKKQARICVHASGIIFQEGGYEPVCYLMLTDISKLEQAESKLNLAKQKLETALDASNTGIWEVDTKTGHIFLDDFCQNIFEFKSFVFDNLMASLLERIHPEDRQPFELDLRRAIVSNSPFMIELRVQSSAVPYTKYIHACAGRAGSDLFVGIMTDFTERRQLEEESKRLKEQQEQMILAASIQLTKRKKRE